MAQTLESFLKKYKLGKDSNVVYTHTKLSGGKYAIPNEKLEEFRQLYHKEVFELGRDCTLTEANSKYTQIKIDLDFRYTTEDNVPRRIYTMEDIVDVVKLYAKAIHEYMYVPESKCAAFIMEKTGPILNQKGTRHSDGQIIIKDGVHIIFPVVTHAKIAHKIRDDVIRDIGTVLDKHKFINSYKDIVDESVIEKNNWFLYGATKANSSAYLVTKIVRYKYDSESANVKITSYPDPSMFTSAQYVEMFSILNRDSDFSRTDIKARYLELLERTGEIEKSEYSRKREQSLNRNKRNFSRIDDEQIKYVCSLVDLTSKERAIAYKDWIEMGWCLHNIHNADDRLLKKWTDWSRTGVYTNTTDDEYKEQWDTFRNDGLGIGTLKMWAKNDNPEGYTAQAEQNIDQTLERMIWRDNLEHNDIAKIYHKKYQHQYVAICKSKTKYVWYHFKDHRWAELGSHSKLRKELSDDLASMFDKKANNYTTRSSNMANDENNDKMRECAQRCLKVSRKLRQTSYKNNILTECQDEFADEAKNFIEKMDENVYLIGCENGIYDLNYYHKDSNGSETFGNFRDGRPDDYVTFSTKINYDASITWDDPRVQEIESFVAQVIPNKNVREYIYQILASCLDGSTKREKMYVFSGSGGNGKSKLIELFDRALGDYSKGVSIALLTKKRADSNAAQPELQVTKGRRAIKFQEAEESATINTGLMKELTGGDKITCRGLFQDPIEFKPQFTPFLICNDKPKLPPHDDGTWRRVRLIEFVSRFVPDLKEANLERNLYPIDYNLSEKIQNWGEPFLWMLIEKYKEYRQNGSVITDPHEVMEYTNAYRRENDIFNAFMNECIVQDSMNSVCYLNDAFREYKAFMKENYSGMGEKPQKKGALQKYMAKILGKEYNPAECNRKTANQRSAGTCWLGYKVITMYTDPQSTQMGGVNSLQTMVNFEDDE